MEGVTLSIDAGVYVEFQDNYSIDVKGTLLAAGNATDSIIFTVNDTTGFSDTSLVDGGWAGIHFDSPASTNDSSVISHCIFTFGKKCGDTLPDYAGGAIYMNNFSNIVISNSSFAHNLARKYGAAIYCGTNSSPVIRECDFHDNKTFYEGGGIYLGSNSNAEIRNSFFINNIAYRNTNKAFGGSGAGIYSSSASLNSACPLIINNQFFNNKSVNGGGIYESNYNITIANNIICNNKGGGIFNGHQLGQGKYINNTICNNSTGGGIGSNSNHLEITNCIIWGNSAYDNTQISSGLGTPSVMYSNIQDGFTGEGNLDTLPMFVSPSDTVGLFGDGSTANWALQDSSPCIDKGTQDTSGLYITLSDILGNPRIVNNRIDMGAIENQNVNNGYDDSHHKEIAVYPNPATNYIVLDTDTERGVDFKLFNGLGQLVIYQKNIHGSDRIILNHIEAGSYYYTITSDCKGGNLKESGKIIIK